MSRLVVSTFSHSFLVTEKTEIVIKDVPTSEMYFILIAGCSEKESQR
jgi:hypothetical protein